MRKVDLLLELSFGVLALNLELESAQERVTAPINNTTRNILSLNGTAST